MPVPWGSAMPGTTEGQVNNVLLCSPSGAVLALREGSGVLCALGTSLRLGEFHPDWPDPARYQHLPMAMLSGLIGVEGVRRLNCSCPSKESQSYWSRAP